MKQGIFHGVVYVTLASLAGVTFAQTSSIGAKNRRIRAQEIAPIVPREVATVKRNKTYDSYSWITAKEILPKTFKVGDLITVIVRETRRFEADAELEIKRQYDLQSELEAMLKLTGGGVGSTNFQRGQPNIDYRLKTKLKGEGEVEREDRMIMRLTGEIIDVKPNGTLVLEARAHIQHDGESSVLTLTGVCRKEDVTPDNTVLSSQLADKTIVVDNQGALRAASSRGWFLKIIDMLSPF